ncbi:MAG: hypothetical protein E7774_04520 [Bradyrhizobium sp.]|nr:MAG: hypothetical protein E7774_04520 [Bradyrhizobium sp.]
MTIVIFAFGLLLIAFGAGSLVASISLVPTELGMLYAACGAILLVGGVVTLALGVVVRRLDRLTGLLRAGQLGEHASEFVSALTGGAHEHDEHERREPSIDAAGEAIGEESAASLHDEALSMEAHTDEHAPEPIGESQTAAAPSSAAIEQARAEAAGPPTLVADYRAGDANYKIFSDGSIEAEMETGAFRFASMDDFKAYLAGGSA